MSKLQAVLIDSREPQWVQALSFGEAPVTVTTLDAGDVWCAVEDAMVIIERKTPSDLLSCIASNRLFQQVARMREFSPWCYVVITGVILHDVNGKVVLDRQSTSWNFDAVMGALVTVQELGVSVVFAQSDSSFGPTVTRLASRHRDAVRIEPTRSAILVTPGEAVLAALPGIGEEKVSALLKHCGTPAWALSHLTTLGENGVPGVGDGIKRGVRRALGLTDDDVSIHVISKGE